MQYLFIGEVGVVCTPVSLSREGSEKICSELQFAHLHVAARPLCVCSCRHLSHLTAHEHRGKQMITASC